MIERSALAALPGCLAALASCIACVAGCQTLPAEPTRDLLDERSGSTLAIVTRPLVFARERTDVAAYARDYATLVAVESNNGGRFRQYLLLYRWSTVDRRMSPPPSPTQGELVIEADGRVIDLGPLSDVPVDLSRRDELHVPANADPVVHAYAVDLGTLGFLAASRELTVRLPQESLATPFTLWKDGRPALARFVRHGLGS